MRRLDTPSPVPNRAPRSAAWRDLACVAVLAVAAESIGVAFNIGESIYRWTRGLERFQFDELPGTLFVLALGLAWFSWRRWRELQRELERRRAIEAVAARLLDDNRRLVREANDVQERERRYLARELHDELGQYLNAISLDGACLRDMTAGRDAEMHRLALGVVSSAGHVYRQIGTMIRWLRPTGLDEFGLPAAVEHCVDGWRARLPDASFSLKVEGDFDDLGDALNIALYRLMQEGLTNVSKCARTARVEIFMVRAPRASVDASATTAPGGDIDEIVITMADDGPGTDLSAPRKGLGLVGMRERVEALGGELRVASQPGNGFMWCARVPVEMRNRPNSDDSHN